MMRPPPMAAYARTTGLYRKGFARGVRDLRNARIKIVRQVRETDSP
jgi:hypothetical protein